jgi:uncharacterized damage-inducible protein DinB
MHYQSMIDEYLAGPELVQQAVRGMSEAQLDSKPIAGKWSTRQVVCHITDFEPVYADRMKRVIAENCPTFFGGDPDTFAAGLAYERRPVDIELELLVAVRRQMATILRQLKAADFQRTGIHSEAGSLSLETLLQRIVNHVPHHVQFIAEKRKALGV